MLKQKEYRGAPDTSEQEERDLSVLEALAEKARQVAKAEAQAAIERRKKAEAKKARQEEQARQRLRQRRSCCGCCW